MKVKELKEIIKDLDDDMDVIIANEVDTSNFHLTEVSSVGHVYKKLEENDALAFTSSNLTNVKTNVEGEGYEVDLLYDDPPETGYPYDNASDVPFIDYKYLWDKLNEKVKELFDNVKYNETAYGGYADGKHNAYSYVLDTMMNLEKEA